MHAHALSKGYVHCNIILCHLFLMTCPQNCTQSCACSLCLAILWKTEICRSDLAMHGYFRSILELNKRREALKTMTSVSENERGPPLCFWDSHTKKNKACRKTTNYFCQNSASIFIEHCLTEASKTTTARRHKYKQNSWWARPISNISIQDLHYSRELPYYFSVAH
jgi:hypothetical protein